MGATSETAWHLLLDHWNETKAFPPWDPDDLWQKVENAFKYAKTPLGIASPEAEFEAVEIDEARPLRLKSARPLPSVLFKDAQSQLDRPYLIRGLINRTSMVVIYGASNSGKTFVALDMAVAIAKGEAWNGRKVNTGFALYLALEGGTGFPQRLDAIKAAKSVREAPFRHVSQLVDLFSEKNEADRVIATIEDMQREFGMPPGILVVDTLARAIAGGDENSSVDMGRLVRACDKIRQATGITVVIIHHTGKDKAKGARGHSSLQAATDTEIEIKDGALTVTKQRDMEKSDDLKFDLRSVEIGLDSEGERVFSCVVVWCGETEFDIPNAGQPLEESHKKLLTTFEAVLCAAPTRSVHYTLWLKSASEVGITKRVFDKTRDDLMERGIVTGGNRKPYKKGPFWNYAGFPAPDRPPVPPVPV